MKRKKGNPQKRKGKVNPEKGNKNEKSGKWDSERGTQRKGWRRKTAKTKRKWGIRKSDMESEPEKAKQKENRET